MCSHCACGSDSAVALRCPQASGAVDNLLNHLDRLVTLCTEAAAADEAAVAAGVENQMQPPPGAEAQPEKHARPSSRSKGGKAGKQPKKSDVHSSLVKLIRLIANISINEEVGVMISQVHSHLEGKALVAPPARAAVGVAAVVAAPAVLLPMALLLWPQLLPSLLPLT